MRTILVIRGRSPLLLQRRERRKSKSESWEYTAGVVDKTRGSGKE